MTGAGTYPSGRGGLREDGAAGMTMLLASVLTGMVALAVVVAATDVGVAAARARTAADAAALAAIAASPMAAGDGDYQRAALEAARVNGADLRRVDDGAWPMKVQVATVVAPRSGLLRGLVPAVEARAAAEVRVPPAPAWPALPSGAGPTRPGGLIRPVDGPVTSGFGYRTHPISGTVRLHAGIDFGAPTGTPIRAAASGVVTAVGWQGGYGLTVVIDHGGGLATLYAHQSGTGVSAGQHVTAGQVIGQVGSTGDSTGPHLHFEVRVGGGAVDPAGYL